MKFLIIFFLASTSWAQGELQKELKPTADKTEVIENPTLKSLSGSLNKFSLYSSFTYNGGSLEYPSSAERPNIQDAEENAGLAEMHGNFGIKYRLTKTDNLSLQLGLYSSTPFHNSIDTDNARNQKDFDQNKGKVDSDDPTLSYFKTYYLGDLQNITFLQYQYATRGIYRDYGLRSVAAISQASAYKISNTSYIAASLTYENYQYDRTHTTYQGFEVSLLPYQTEHKLRGNLSFETYFSQKVSMRLISDVFSYYRMRKETENLERKLQQTVAMTYFFSRDISIAPNIKFIAEDIRDDRTNIGINLTVNI